MATKRVNTVGITVLNHSNIIASTKHTPIMLCVYDRSVTKYLP